MGLSEEADPQMIAMKYGPFTLGEAFFRRTAVPAGMDAVLYRQLPSPEGLVRPVTQATLLLDLSRPEDELFQAIEKSARYEIRRSETKDGTRCRLLQARDLTDAYLVNLAERYREFAQTKGIVPMNLQRLRQLRAAGMLLIGQADAEGGETLAWHVYLVAHRRARLLYSLSRFRDSEDPQFKGMVGRANRHLHWEDVRALKALGVATYDFGGFYLGRTDEAKLRINHFKLEFRGVQATEYNGFHAQSLKGRLVGRLYALALPLVELASRWGLR
jgi:hypothetical protein